MGWASRYREVQAEKKAASKFGDDYGAEPVTSKSSMFGMTGAQMAVLGLGAIFLGTVILEKKLKKAGG